MYSWDEFRVSFLLTFFTKLVQQQEKLPSSPPNESFLSDLSLYKTPVRYTRKDLLRGELRRIEVINQPYVLGCIKNL